ncbi:uncharacterized protein SAPINGB_P004463 [Magnusiomyces paraingens]|uniref:Uncharacterized protein n=1 Tax=Magnusiomyces paraingens TaxID=2606893 RepID=A0A5E8BUK7_9ASCO|nr:uncharacterized protein SAPINGB_P004463 [Saprochaete ingens]VVT55172.1 unnamed protein product [Saprochaete ingens]
MAATNPEYYTHSSGHKISRIQTSGFDDDIIHIGDTSVNKYELMAAFGGTLNPGLAPPPSRKFANPSPLGLCAFALTTFVLSLVNIRARHATNPSVVIGLAYFYGGFIQLLAGMWEIVVENTFPAVALSSYGGFWLSWAAINTDSFGIVSSYTTTDELEDVLGYYLMGWVIFTTLLVSVTLRSTFAFFGLFFTLDMTFLFLAIEKLARSPACGKIAGWWGLAAAFFAWYNAYAGLATPENSYIVVKPLYMPGAMLPRDKTKDDESK